MTSLALGGCRGLLSRKHLQPNFPAERTILVNTCEKNFYIGISQKGILGLFARSVWCYHFTARQPFKNFSCPHGGINVAGRPTDGSSHGAKITWRNSVTPYIHTTCRLAAPGRAPRSNTARTSPDSRPFDSAVAPATLERTAARDPQLSLLIRLVLNVFEVKYNQMKGLSNN